MLTNSTSVHNVGKVKANCIFVPVEAGLFPICLWHRFCFGDVMVTLCSQLLCRLAFPAASLASTGGEEGSEKGCCRAMLLR